MSEIERLLKQVGKGDKDAIFLLIERFMPLIRKYSFFEDPLECEDCRQYIITNLVIAIDKFRPVIGCLCDDGGE